MNELITVKILEGGRQAREVNPLGYKPNYQTFVRQMKSIYGKTKAISMYYKSVEKYQEAESKLRTFEIEVEPIHPMKQLNGTFINVTPTVGKNYQAKVLDNGKVIIL
jgi:hypothetical protein